MWAISRPHKVLPAALLVVGVCIGTPACAAQTYGYRGGYYRDIQRRAYDNGYREGLKDGEKDARSRRSFSIERHDDWQDADDGYRRSDGDFGLYRQTFRQGFEAGYNEAYNRYARAYGYSYPPRSTFPTYPTYPTYPGVGRYGSPGAQVGYRDGFEVGRDDARDRESYDPIRSRRYRSADHDYDNRYGSKDEYKREYRDAFRRGYDEGYRGSLRRF